MVTMKHSRDDERPCVIDRSLRKRRKIDTVRPDCSGCGPPLATYFAPVQRQGDLEQTPMAWATETLAALRSPIEAMESVEYFDKVLREAGDNASRVASDIKIYGGVVLLVETLPKCTDDLKVNILRVLTKIAGTSEAEYLAEIFMVKLFVYLSPQSSTRLRENALACFEKLCSVTRVVDRGDNFGIALSSLSNIMEQPWSPSVVNTATSALAQLCHCETFRHHAKGVAEYLHDLLTDVCYWIDEFENGDELASAGCNLVQVFEHLSADEKLCALVPVEVVYKLVFILKNRWPCLRNGSKRSAMECLKNVTEVSESHRLIAFNLKAPQYIVEYLKPTEHRSVVLAACRLVNAMAMKGTPNQITLLIENADLVDEILAIAQGGTNITSAAALLALANLCIRGSPEQVRQLVRAKVLESFTDYMKKTVKQQRVLLLILEAIGAVVGKKAEGEFGIDKRLKERLGHLSASQTEKVAAKAEALLSYIDRREQAFDEEEGADENLSPATHGSNDCTFVGLPPKALFASPNRKSGSLPLGTRNLGAF